MSTQPAAPRPARHRDAEAALDRLRPTGPPEATPVDVPRHPDGRVDLVRLLAASTTLLETRPQSGAEAGTSYAVVGTAGRLLHDGTTTLLVDTDGAHDLGPDPFAALDAVATVLESTPDAPHPPDVPGDLTAGLVGAWSYDLGRVIEDVPTTARADRDHAWLDLAVVTAVVVVDHDTESATLVRRALVGTPNPPGAVDVQTALSDPAPPDVAVPARLATSTMTPQQHHDGVRTILDHIAAGDTFQVNLAHRLSTSWEADDVALYRALRDQSPAPHLAVHRCHDGASIVSISPETFLHARDGIVRTRPIKGTRPRHTDAGQDAAARDDLVRSAKDRAENVMVVDMERNDLGRVCLPGSVTVPELLEVEAHPTVWQLVSTIEGRLAPGVGWGGLLRATFPCGSVTGTPKVAAMAIIDRLEPVRRSWYCGAIGFLAPGRASLSVAIRTAVVDGGRVDYAAGGGIVADSDPIDEYDETLAKARAFLDAVNAEVAT